MGDLDSIMGGVGLFGGSGAGGGALGGYIAAVVKMIYLLAAEGSVPFVEANAQLGELFGVVGRANGAYVAARQVLSSPTPTTPEGWVDYANRVFVQSRNAVEQGRAIVERVGAQVGAAGGQLGAVEACLATPDGGIHTAQCAGMANTIGAQAQLNGNALMAAQTGMMLQEKDEGLAGQKAVVDRQGATFGFDQPLGGENVVDPWKGY